MRVSLVAGFGAGLAPDLPLIASLQFAEVRRDVTVEHIKEYAQEFVSYPNLHVLCILRSPLDVPVAQLVAESAEIAWALVQCGLEHRSGIEIGNEPNLTKGWAKDPKQFQAAVNACAKAIRNVSPVIDVVSGGVSNTGAQQQAWLKALVNGLDPSVVVGYHTYRLESADTPQTGFTSRAAEQAALLAILGTRRRVNTETGWNSLKHTVRYGSFNLYRRTVQLTEAQVADYVRREFQIAEDAGCESIALYQLNDELSDNGQGFGIRRPDGSVKPVAAIPAEFAETPPEPPMPPHKYVRIGVNGLAAGVIPTGVLRLDAGSVEYAGVWDGRFTFELPGDVQPWGATVIVTAPGYVTVDNYRFALTPVTRDWGGVSQDVVNVDLVPVPPVISKWTPSKAQLAAIQCDLMIWCPEAKPTFVNDLDAELQIRRVDNQGAVARGIEAGWVWCTTIAHYPPEKRQLIYRAAKAAGHTHFALHVGQLSAGSGYHSVYPMTVAMADGYGAAMNTVHQELLAHRLIPVCAGVAPGVPPAAGFDASQVLVAMTDWDNSAAAASRIKAVAETFPQALVFYELPEGEIYPKPSPDDPIAPTPDNGGAWIRGVQQRWPNFAGVVYEVNHPDGIEANVAQLTKAHTWWRDVAENQGEIDTYWKFWDNLGNDEARAYNDALAARCPWLSGSMSGWTMRPPPPDEDTTTVPTTSVGDMIPPSSILVDDVPAVMTWPATAKITRLELRQSGVHVEFSKRLGDGSWPDMPFGIGGKDTLQFSMGLCLRKNGQWYAASPLQCWRTQDENGGPIMAQAVEGTAIGQIAKNWFYDTRWPNLRGYQPQPGDTIGLYCVAGDIRGFAATGAGLTVHERTNIVTFPLPAPGKSNVLTWA